MEHATTRAGEHSHHYDETIGSIHDELGANKILRQCLQYATSKLYSDDKNDGGIDYHSINNKLYDHYFDFHNNDENDTIHYADPTTTSSTSTSYHHTVRMIIHRLLGGGESEYSYKDEEGELRIDYSVLSVGVMTLGLIMVVELFRHRLDHAAKGRPFFKTVLEGVYTELATLGMVEFVLFLMTQYYHGYDKAKKEVFASVHFLLFYVAILNAFQSCFLAAIAHRIANEMWVATEELELNHYIEMREEFQLVSDQLQNLHHVRRRNNMELSHHGKRNRPSGGSTSGSSDGSKQGDHTRNDNNNSNNNKRGGGHNDNPMLAFLEREFEYTRHGFIELWHTLYDRVRHPHLKYKYDTLLTQIRFHELRVAFIKAYNLPIQLRVSDYLIRCQLQVLIKLVNVSSFAWLALTAAANFLYFILGIISYKLHDPELVGTILIWIYFSSLLVFIWVAWITYNKMKAIFRSMMKDKTMWEVPSNNASEEEKERVKKQQLAMFWGRDPTYVIAAIQFMQFGYAVCFSALIIFWDQINDAPIPMYTYMVAMVICYGIFLYLIGRVIPRYAMCTSLAQMVNTKLLRETLAAFHLEEVKRKHQELEMQRMAISSHSVPNVFSADDQSDYPNETGNVTASKNEVKVVVKQQNEIVSFEPANFQSHTITPEHELPAPENVIAAISKPDDTNAVVQLSAMETNPRTSRRKRAVSAGVSLMASENYEGRSSSLRLTSEDFDRSIQRIAGTRDILETSSSRFSAAHSDPFVSVASNLNVSKTDDEMDIRKLNRRRNRKSISDGVALMAKMADINDFKDETATDKAQPKSEKRVIPPYDSGKNKLAVDTAALMVELVNKDISELRGMLTKFEKQQKQKNTQTRYRRKKTVSDGVDSMADSTRSFDDSNTAISFSDVDDSRTNASITHSLSDHGELMTRTPQNDSFRARRRSERRTVSDGVELMAKLTLFQSEATLDDLPNNGTDVAKNVTPKPEPGRNSSPGYWANESGVLQAAKKNSDSVEETNTKLSFSKDERGDDMSATLTDGYCSDDDDIPDYDHSSPTSVKERLSLKTRLATYFGSKKYVVVSNLFGTTAVFFLVAKRVESFLHSEDILSNLFISFHFPLKTTFWILVCWLSLFLCGSMLTFYAKWPMKGLQTTLDKKVVIAAVLDTIITSTCLIVFLFAERRRCCVSGDNHNERYLAEEYQDTATVSGHVNYDNICTCPAFGTRTYGGLGTLEPYTSLISLRVLRHYVAKRIIGIFNWAEPKRTDDDGKSDVKEAIADPFSVFDEDHHDNSKESTNLYAAGMVGTAAELWEAAIVRHPELVSQYGEFSGELLRAMLGIHIVAREGLNKTGSNSPPNPANGDEPINISMSCLSDESSNRNPGNVTSFNGRVLSDNIEQGQQQLEPMLEADDYSLQMEHEFSFPNARLIRNMRRCDRKLLPLLDKWTVVDVVMTQFEIVSFAATGSVDSANGPFVERTKQDIIASKGGKQLRLRDVAAGRRVVGHLRFSEIQSIIVERYMPGAAAPCSEDSPDVEVENTEFWQPQVKSSVLRSETRSMVWETVKQDILKIGIGHGRTVCFRFYSDLEEAMRHEDRLAAEDELFGDIFKNNALQWAQTIGRLCGRDQLVKQNLPHFGGDNCDELRDYIVMQYPKPETTRGVSFRLDRGVSFRMDQGVGFRMDGLSSGLPSFRFQHRRHHTVGEELLRLGAVDSQQQKTGQTLPYINENAVSSPKPRLRRAHTQGEIAIPPPPPPPNSDFVSASKPSFRRAVTISEEPSITQRTGASLVSKWKSTAILSSVQEEDVSSPKSTRFSRPKLATRANSYGNAQDSCNGQILPSISNDSGRDSVQHSQKSDRW